MNEVFNILVAEAGANENIRDQFACWWNTKGSEFRFQGSLGFGGKFWRNYEHWYINCYPEDESPQRLAVIEKVNNLLKELMEQ
jgi:hypothetical protein